MSTRYLANQAARRRAGSRQIRHALTALARTSRGRRSLIRICAEEYLRQVDRHILPMGYDQPISTDEGNRADAYRMRRGKQFAEMLGISCKPASEHLPDTARAVIAALDAPVQQLTEAARRCGNPAGIAVAYLVAGCQALRT